MGVRPPATFKKPPTSIRLLLFIPAVENVLPLQLDFWYDNSLISRDIFDGLKKCDMKTGALWRTDGPSGFSVECEKLRDKALEQIGTIDLYGLNAPICVPPSNDTKVAAKYPSRGEPRGIGVGILRGRLTGGFCNYGRESATTMSFAQVRYCID